MDDGYFGEDVAAGYDAASAGRFAPEAVEPAADLLAELAGGGRALELGVGVTFGDFATTRVEGWAYDVYEVATQATTSNYVDVADGRGTFRSIPFRHVWPSELHHMAQLAGLRLRDRWAG